MKRLTKLHKTTLILFVITGMVALATILKLSDNTRLQFSVLTGLVVFYLVWGIFYHHIDKSIKAEIVIEYFLTAALILSFLYGILI